MSLSNRTAAALSKLSSFCLFFIPLNRKTICLVSSAYLFLKDIPSHPTSKLIMMYAEKNGQKYLVN